MKRKRRYSLDSGFSSHDNWDPVTMWFNHNPLPFLIICFASKFSQFGFIWRRLKFSNWKVLCVLHLNHHVLQIERKIRSTCFWHHIKNTASKIHLNAPFLIYSNIKEMERTFQYWGGIRIQIREGSNWQESKLEMVEKQVEDEGEDEICGFLPTTA